MRYRYLFIILLLAGSRVQAADSLRVSFSKKHYQDGRYA